MTIERVWRGGDLPKWPDSKFPQIPSVSPDELLRRAEKIAPLMLADDGNLYHIKPPESLSGVAFTWEPILTVVAKPVEAIRDMVMLHTYGYYGLFKPSLDEVLSQIPVDVLPIVDAFEMLRHQDSAAGMRTSLKAFNAGFHVSLVRLYQFKKP